MCIICVFFCITAKKVWCALRLLLLAKMPISELTVHIFSSNSEIVCSCMESLWCANTVLQPFEILVLSNQIPYLCQQSTLNELNGHCWRITMEQKQKWHTIKKFPQRFCLKLWHCFVYIIQKKSLKVVTKWKQNWRSLLKVRAKQMRMIR